MELKVITEFSSVVDLLDNIATRAEHLRPAMEVTTEEFTHEFEIDFTVQGRPPWTPLAASTVRTRVREGYPPGPILHRTGALEGGALDPSSWEVHGGGQSIIADFRDPTYYGHFHITGTTEMPERNWTYFSPETLDKMEEFFIDWILTGAIH